MVKGIWFGDIHSYENLNLILSKVDLPPAAVKETFVDNPGGDGSWDLTEANGKVNYKNRTAKFTFSVLPEDDFETKKTEVSNLLSGRRFKIVLDKDPDYYWDGRCSINKYESKKKDRKIVVAANVAPHKLKKEKTVVGVDLSNDDCRSNAVGNPLFIDNVSPVEHSLGLKICGMTRKCANLMLPLQEGTNGGITIQRGANGVFHLSGTATEDSVQTVTLNLPKGVYSLKLNCSKNIGTTYSDSIYLILRDRTYEWLLGVYGWNDGPYFKENIEIYDVMFVVSKGVNVDGVTIAPMLNEGTTALPYEPYFEGLRSAPASKVDQVGENLFKAELGGDGYFASGFYDLLEVADDNTIVGIPKAGQGSDYVRFAQKYPPGVYTMGNKGADPRQMLWIFDANGQNVSSQYQSHFGIPYNSYYDGFYSPGNKLIADIPSTVAYWRFGVFFQPNSGNKVTLSEIQVSRGTDIPYKPYHLNTLPIPAEVQAIEGYGWGINESVYNYVDLEKKQFVQRVGRVDMGTLDWHYVVDGKTYLASYSLANKIRYFAANEVANILCEKYEAGTADAVYTGWANLSSHSTTVWVHDTAYTDAATFKAAMNGVMFYYELAEPIITDISHLMGGKGLNSIHPAMMLSTDDGAILDVTYYNSNHLPKDIVLTNGRKVVVPTVECSDDDTRIEFEGGVVTVNAGTHKILDLQLKEGENPISVAGFGRTTFSYQEGDL